MTNEEQKAYRLANTTRVMKDLGITLADYNAFCKIGEKLNKVYTWQCNGYDDKGNTQNDKGITALWNKKEKELTKQAKSLARGLMLYIYFQTDPRGATIYLDNEPIPENNYNSAHCIY